MNLRKSLLVVLAVTVSAVAVPAVAGDLKDGWKKRTARAHAHLKETGLDVCDMAYEKAYASPKERKDGSQQTFDLTFEIGESQMKVAYVYEGTQLARFLLVAMPPRWLAYQKADNKTLSVVVADEKCAFDLCTNDPFASGACPGESVL